VPSGRTGDRHSFLWLFLFFMLPFFIVLKISFAEADVAIPPYTEIYTFVEQKFQLVLNLANYTCSATTSCTSRPTWVR
jgi:ABC-type spermidine/putrescine transport system permease subunit I